MSMAAPALRLRLPSFVVIPARLASTRLPRKLLLAETGKPLIQHTYEAARRATRPFDLCVATDSDEIARAVRAFGGKAVMTSAAHPSGADRVAEVARDLVDMEIIVNVQGDEPDLRGYTESLYRKSAAITRPRGSGTPVAVRAVLAVAASSRSP